MNIHVETMRVALETIVGSEKAELVVKTYAALMEAQVKAYADGYEKADVDYDSAHADGYVDGYDAALRDIDGLETDVPSVSHKATLAVKEHEPPQKHDWFD